jgi:flavin reductase (DIM6/NTAB) family NADH-FMN oxidoreductase RutF
MMPSGLYVLGTRAGARRNLMTISWVTQVALEPKLMGVGVESAALTNALIVQGRVFALSILARSERALVRKFVKPVEDQAIDEKTSSGTMKGVAVVSASTGAPVLEVAVAWIDCELRHVLELGSHSWFVGEVVDCGIGSGSPVEDETGEDEAGEPLRPTVLRMEDTRMSYGG